jgi:GH15 family glucan-1,4-alpha-glucosidase
MWEVRSKPRHFTHSKVMAWVGLDRCIRGVRDHGLQGNPAAWRSAAAEIRATVLSQGFNQKINAFTRELRSNDLDASALLFPQLGFIEPDDPRMLGTVSAIEQRLMQDGYVRRYDVEQSSDGLHAPENAFLACSCWLADCYILQGRLADAEQLFARVLAARNDLGLLAEEFDPASGELMGNFPQALSHIAMLNTAFNLARARGPAQQRREDRPPEDTGER